MRPAPRDLLPLLTVLVPLLALGLWADHAGLARADAIGPRTMFTPGQHLAAAIASAQVQELGRFSTTTDLVGWPDLADFRAVMWPTQLLAVLTGPLTAVNLIFALTPALNALGAWWLGRSLGLGRWASVALAGMAGYSPWVRETWMNGQLEQAVVGTVAVMWATGLAAARQPTLARVLLAGAVTWAVGMTSPHLCLAACLGLGAWAGWEAVSRRPALAAVRAWLPVLAVAAVALLVAGRYHSPNFTAGVQVFFPKGSDGHPGGLAGLPEQATLASLLLPPSDRPTDIVVLHPTWLGAVTLGGVGLALWHRSRAPRASGAPMGLLAAGGVLVLFSLGADIPFGRVHVPGPFALLGMVSPTITQSGSAYRMIGAAVVALAAVAASVVQGPRSAAALVLAAWAETTLAATRPLPFLPMDFAPDPVAMGFNERDSDDDVVRSGAVLDLPLVGPGCPDATFHYVFEATRRLRPVPILPAAPGIYPTVPGLPGEVRAATQLPDCGEALATVIPGWGFTAVALHDHAGCTPTARLIRCLESAFGPGESTHGLRWWDPLPPPADGSAPGAHFPRRPLIQNAAHGPHLEVGPPPEPGRPTGEFRGAAP